MVIWEASKGAASRRALVRTEARAHPHPAMPDGASFAISHCSTACSRTANQMKGGRPLATTCDPLPSDIIHYRRCKPRRRRDTHEILPCVYRIAAAQRCTERMTDISMNPSRFRRRSLPVPAARRIDSPAVPLIFRLIDGPASHLAGEECGSNPSIRSCLNGCHRRVRLEKPRAAPATVARAG